VAFLFSMPFAEARVGMTWNDLRIALLVLGTLMAIFALLLFLV